MTLPATEIGSPAPLSMDDFGHMSEIVLRQLVGYWLEKRSGRSMPSKADIDPVEIPWALSHIWICDYLADSKRFRYRLAGEEVNAVAEQSLAGKFLDETLPPDRSELILRKYHAVVEKRGILHDSGRVYLLQNRQATGERIILPLADDGETVDAIVGATVYEWGTADPSSPASDLEQHSILTKIDTGETINFVTAAP